ncbi:hypothetical protein B0H17DRAFT_1146902 [Mycena rosella]|uniref:Uncharacterized protein n=1 Tax=Mycena rosella TaxID=1033263 RepID=A0AAD7CMV5_MYCRO|nr:hypothetical protein B0H17DRAFT_1146902 [Mycena rosella]
MVGIVHKCPRLLERRASDCGFRDSVAAGTRPIPPSKGVPDLFRGASSCPNICWRLRRVKGYASSGRRRSGKPHLPARSDMGRTTVEDAYQTCFAARRRVRKSAGGSCRRVKGVASSAPPGTDLRVTGQFISSLGRCGDPLRPAAVAPLRSRSSRFLGVGSQPSCTLVVGPQA